VVGTRVARTPGSAHVIRSKELERFEYDDPTAVLNSAPGVYSRTEDGMGLRPNIGMRGVDPDRSKKITLMEDGVLFGPAPYSAPAAYYFPLITRMSQVQVIKGPGSVAYGPQTVAGAVDLITRAIPSETSGTLDLALGQHGYAKAHGSFGASTDQFGFVVEGVHLQNSGFKELPDKDADTGAVRNEWMAKFFYVVDPNASVRNEFRLKLTYSDETSNETYLGLAEQDFRDNPYQRYGASSLDRFTNHRFSAVLTHQVDFNARTSLTTSAYRHTMARSWRRVDGFSSARLFDILARPEGGDDALTQAAYLDALRGRGDLSAVNDREALILATNGRQFVSEGVTTRLRWEHQTGDFGHRLEAGLRVHYDRIERRHTASPYDLFQGEPYPRNVSETTAFNKGATYAVSPHVLYALSYRGLTLTPGLRAELMRMSFINRATGDGSHSFNYALLPGASAYYAITRELGVLAGVHRGFSPSTPENAKTQDPEKSINYEAGARYTRGPLRGEVIGFYNDYSNLIGYCTVSEGCTADRLDQQTSAGRAKIYGVEVLAGHEVPAGPVKLPLSLAYTFTRAEFGETFQSVNPSWGLVKKGDPIPYVPAHQLRATAGVEGKPAGGNVAFTYVASVREGEITTPNGTLELKTDDQYLVDANVWAQVWGPFKLYVNAQNLLNSTYVVARRPFGARPNAPRWVQVGLKAAF
jgi:Fe(3+) dicitrate transport protein